MHASHMYTMRTVGQLQNESGATNNEKAVFKEMIHFSKFTLNGKLAPECPEQSSPQDWSHKSAAFLELTFGLVS